MPKTIPVAIALLTAIIITLFPLNFVRAQLEPAAIWTADLGSRYRIVPNITYLKANNYDLKLDLYLPRKATSPRPTFLFIHGGGWIMGSKEESLMEVIPYLEMGWNVVNVQYRLASVSPAPAAVEDCRCALRWVIRNAKEYNFDINKIVAVGVSAGGHLALTTGMLPASAGLDRQCPGNRELKVAAIINWLGITDVVDLIDGKNMKTFAVQWLGSQSDRSEIAKRVSPLTYVRKGLPPILTIHGDADNIVPYSHAVRLHQALEKVGVTNQLLTIRGGTHDYFTRDEYIKIYTVIREFLAKNNLT